MRKNRKRLLLYLVPGVVLVGVVTWFLIRIVTIDTAINIINLYEAPKSPSLNNIHMPAEGDWAVAIDGNVVAGKSFETGEDTALPTASTAKIILGLAIMQEKPFVLGEKGEMITISQEDYERYIWYINNNGSNTTVRVGEEINEYDALISVFLASSNNMADTLAVWAFGSIDAYREYAKNMLQEWGIVNTNIGDDASGFSDTTTSTASDLAKIGAKVLENPVLAEIVGTKEYVVPIAGTIENTNQLLGINNIVGIKTGYIGEESGYCLVTGYKEGEHIITVALMGAPTRAASFSDSKQIVQTLQELVKVRELVSENQVIGYYDSWWTGLVPIMAETTVVGLVWDGAEISTDIIMVDESGELEISVDGWVYKTNVRADAYAKLPTLIERIKHIFGWRKETMEEPVGGDVLVDDIAEAESEVEEEISAEESGDDIEPATEQAIEPFTYAQSSNCTIDFGALMLINPNFPVEENFIATRRGELVSISSLYGIAEGNAYNGDNLLDAEAAVHINDMVKAYEATYPGHTLETRSCFRSRGTNCGRLCMETGASDHHTGLTCDLLDSAYGTELDTDTYDQHIDWQWLHANSYKYGFIDRFPEAWAGGPMSEPRNLNENGTTGLYETWHYRYVGIDTATEIATGKYNNGEYDSLEHYLKARGLVTDLINGKCYNS